MKVLGWSFGITATTLVVAYFYGGLQALVLCPVLGTLAINLRFDTGVLNARSHEAHPQIAAFISSVVRNRRAVAPERLTINQLAG